jgi:hypothetical protein
MAGILDEFFQAAVQEIPETWSLIQLLLAAATTT